jgi:triacylglycerol lipase
MKLISQAYQQYQCYKDDKPFILRGPGVMIAPITAKDGRPFGFVARDFNNLYLVFRGTASWRDWLVNVETHQVHHPFGKVHEGGYELYQQLWPSIYAAITAQHAGLKLVIVGHSLGAWPATFAAVDLSHMNPTVHVYGSPRVGDKLFADNVNKLVPHYTRYINSEDTIPTLPLPDDYCHIGTVESFTVSTGDLSDNHAISLYEQNCD